MSKHSAVEPAVAAGDGAVDHEITLFGRGVEGRWTAAQLMMLGTSLVWLIAGIVIYESIVVIVLASVWFAGLVALRCFALFARRRRRASSSS